MSPTRHTPLVTSLAVVLLFASACHDHAEDPMADAVVEACAHLRDGPAQAHTLAKTAAGAPDLTSEHQRLDLTFVDLGDGSLGGHGLWKSGAAGDVVLLLSADVPVLITDAAGATVTAETTQASPAGCAEAAVVHRFELGVGTYTLRFTASGDTGVKAMLTGVDANHAH